MKSKLIVALDVPDISIAKQHMAKLGSEVDYFKIGSQLFTLYGPAVVQEALSCKGDVFLDLKYHDIPNTVEKAARAAVRLGVSIFNVHAVGGLDMMKSAVLGAKEESQKLGVKCPVVLGVTVLTSMSEEMHMDCFGKTSSISDTVLFLCSQAKKAGLDGVVSSPLEIGLIKEHMGKDFQVLTPGIRPEWSETGDQKRFTTPQEAVKAGADYLVIGRPILNSPDPCDAVKRIREAMKNNV